MNKRFSTLLATALVAGSLSAYAQGTPAQPAGPGTGDDAVKNGEYTFLYVGGATDVLTVDGSKLKTVTAPDGSAAAGESALEKLNKALWQVTVIPSTSVAGGNTYSFVNKATGQSLAVVLKSNTKADKGVALNNAVTVGGTGANATWGWSTDKGLYAVKGDSTFTFKAGASELQMEATHKDATNAGAPTIAIIGHKPLTLEMPLTAADFNTLTKGKLYFKGGKDVTTGNTNVLTANTWKAVNVVGGTTPAGTGYVNLQTAGNKYLIVDTAFYTGTTDAYKLGVDTIYHTTAGSKENNPANQRKRETYEFKPMYNVAADSIVLLIAKHPVYAKDAKPSEWAQDATAYTVANSSSATTGQIILRTLANATVLTVEYTGNVKVETAGTAVSYVVKPLIQPTAGNLGGTAKITPNKVYYIADMRGYANSKVNANNGKFYDGSAVNMTNYLEAGQAFNMFSQFVVTATPGTDKGNYIIKDRVFGETIWSGVADSLENGNIVFGTDTIKLVDANIAYAGKAQNIAFFANDHALKNKQFQIQSASPLLDEEMFIHMKKDSTMTLKAGEVMYNLVRLDSRAYNDAAIKDAVDNLTWETYAIKTSKGEYLVLDNNGRYILTSDPAKYNYTVGYKYTDGAEKDASKSFIRTGFTFIPTDAADKFVIVPTFPCVTVGDKNAKEDKVAVSSYYSIIPKAAEVASGKTNTLTKVDITSSLAKTMATVNTNSGDLENEKLGEVKYDLFYVAEEEDPQSLFTMPKHIQLETTNNQFVTVNAKNEALVVAENALKADKYTAEDFTFWLDTAAYNRNGETLVTPSYYVTRGVLADTTTKVDAHRLYMYNAADSAANATVNKEQYSAYESTRVIFRTAQRFGADSLIVVNGAKQDTLTLDGKAPATSAIKAPKAGVNKFRFNFVQAKDQAAGVYNIKNGDDYLRNLNGVLVIGKLAEGVMVTVNTTDAPTSNEAIDAETVKVIAGNATIQILNAQGKKVAISNILGQTIANTVLSSDNAVIAAPAGVIVVAVEGEEAVKAIVK